VLTREVKQEMNVAESAINSKTSMKASYISSSFRKPLLYTHITYVYSHRSFLTVKFASRILAVSQSTFFLVLQKMTAWVMVKVSYKSHRVSNFHSSFST